MGKLKDWFGWEHVNCKDPNCLSKIEDVEDWDNLFFGEYDPEKYPKNYSPCCGHCGCCPCRSIRCPWCRSEIQPFKLWHSITWKLWGEREWKKFMEARERDLGNR